MISKIDKNKNNLNSIHNHLMEHDGLGQWLAVYNVRDIIARSYGSTGAAAAGGVG